MWQQSAAAAYTSNISLCSRKDISREESSLNMKIFIGLKDLHAELLGLTMLNFFLSVTSMTRFGTYFVIHMQSTNMVEVRTKVRTAMRATSHLTISMRGQHPTGKIQRNNYHHGNCGQSLTGKTSSVSFIFTHWTHRNVKNR